VPFANCGETGSSEAHQVGVAGRRRTEGRRAPAASVGSVVGKWEDRMKNLIVRIVREEDGQDIAEYALLVAGIAILAMAGITLFGNAMLAFFSGIAASIPGAGS
jgi:pilus assembly protein Flp/PilA